MDWKQNKLVKYLIESVQELKKVTWPNRRETMTSTLLVIGVSIGVAVFLGAVDFGLSRLLALLVK